MEKLTISDIAALVDVSTATISNYLNGNYGRMSDKTKNKIERMIAETNYIPSSSARSLATNNNRTIGVSVADITNPFTSAILSGIYKACEELEYTVIFTNSNSNKLQEIDNINKLKRQEVSGLIIDPVDADSPIFKTVNNSNAMMIDRQATTVKIDTVVTDNFNAVKNFIHLMINDGYEDIYYVSWPIKQVSTRMQRYAGFQNATNYKNNHCLEIDPQSTVAEVAQDLESIMEENSRKKIGFFTMNGKVLTTLIYAMRSINKQYAIDYGLGSYEDLDWMGIMEPGITCIHQDSFGMGETAARKLIKKLTQKKSFDDTAKLIVVPTTISMRNSF